MFELFGWYSFEQALIVASPGTKDPVLWMDLVKDANHLLLISKVEMNWSFDLGVVEEFGNLFFKLD